MSAAQAAVALHHALGAIEGALARVARVLEGSACGGSRGRRGREVSAARPPRGAARLALLLASACGCGQAASAAPGLDAGHEAGGVDAAAVEAGRDARGTPFDAAGEDAPSYRSGCPPTTCAALGYGCGWVPDGCGGSLNCGECAAPAFCGGGGFDLCGVGDGGSGQRDGASAGCTPRTCADQHIACGGASDGCGVLLGCGTCSGPGVCIEGQCVYEMQ